MDSTQLNDFLHGQRINLAGQKSTSKEYAESLDKKDPLAHFRNEFLIPSKADLKTDKPTENPNDPGNPCIYLCGNSLGLQTKRLRSMLDEELSIWATRGVTGHFNHPKSRPWVSSVDSVAREMAKVVGALPSEVAVMGSLTENLHILLASFYRPDRSGKGRTKLIIEGKAFPSDHYAVKSQIEWHGLDPKEHLVCIFPKCDTYTLTTEQILRAIDEHADDTALLMLSGVQFYTGQAFDIKHITQYAQSKNIMVGWDLAHAVGNIPLELHEWGVDFASWCTYKYLCSGPGGMSGIFVHDKHDEAARHRLAGWWGHDPTTRFQMDNTFKPSRGASGYQLSNPSVIGFTALRASLSVYNQTSMTSIRKKSEQITGYLEHLLNVSFPGPIDSRPFKIITPNDPNQRGAQLSLLFQPGIMMPIFHKLEELGVIVDERKPYVIRVAPVPLYNSYVDVWTFVEALKLAVKNVKDVSIKEDEIEVKEEF